MKGLRNCTIALLLGMSAPVLIWVGAFAALRTQRSARLVCSTDSDCPPGFTCSGGRCVPAR